ncbi:MAG: 1,6-anhydro-N-acetylmuramyl-L-alanine amidase AmpD [Sterolibacterium sp.]|nr:1,6-anhydro-N-acetylmuramyl-L-alanine amidase AmpD [Sterolibacterium sp.]
MPPVGAGSEAGLDEGGIVTGITYIPSPNCDERPPGETISLIVIHAISLPPGEFGGEGVTQLFTNQLSASEHPYYAEIHALRVSAHFLIRRDGALIQYVPCQKRAWHAGVSNWNGRERCNDFSIGIELEGCDDQAFEEAQYHRLVDLLALLVKHYPEVGIVGHTEIAPGRKTDPGPRFDWSRISSAHRLP